METVTVSRKTMTRLLIVSTYGVLTAIFIAFLAAKSILIMFSLLAVLTVWSLVSAGLWGVYGYWAHQRFTLLIAAVFFVLTLVAIARMIELATGGMQ